MRTKTVLCSWAFHLIIWDHVRCLPLPPCLSTNGNEHSQYDDDDDDCVSPHQYVVIAMSTTAVTATTLTAKVHYRSVGQLKEIIYVTVHFQRACPTCMLILLLDVIFLSMSPTHSMSSLWQ